MTAPVDAHDAICSACHRTRNHLPRGFVIIRGKFFGEHRDELLRLVRELEQREKAEHPLERIIKIEEIRHGAMVSTTGAHLARGIGEALHHVYQGDLEFHYSKEWLSVTWTR